MAVEITTTTEIAATPGQVWDVLVALGEWPAWHPAIVEFVGTASPGARVRFRTRSPEGGGTFTLKPRVLAAEPGRLLRWRGHVLVPGLFDATHEFTLQPAGSVTRVVQRETFTGILSGVLSGVIRRAERDNARADAALKARVEAGASRPDQEPGASTPSLRASAATNSSERGCTSGSA